jgi:hypothetical protein
MLATRFGNSAKINCRCATPISDQREISATVRAQPMHNPLNGSTTQTFMQGLVGVTSGSFITMLLRRCEANEKGCPGGYFRGRRRRAGDVAGLPANMAPRQAHDAHRGA